MHVLSQVRQISALCNRLQNSQSIEYDEKCDTLQELTLLCQQHQNVSLFRNYIFEFFVLMNEHGLLNHVAFVQDIGDFVDIFLILFEERTEARDDDFEMTTLVLNVLLACVSESHDVDHSPNDKPAHVSNADYIVSAGMYLNNFIYSAYFNCFLFCLFCLICFDLLDC
jgi:hypothetical protein